MTTMHTDLHTDLAEAQAALERVRALADSWAQAAAISAFPASFRLHMSLRADELRDALNNQEVPR